MALDTVVVSSLSHVRFFCEPPRTIAIPGFSVHGISQARILEWVVISFSRGSSRPKDRTCFSCIGRRILYLWAKIPQKPENWVNWESSEDLSKYGKIQCYLCQWRECVRKGWWLVEDIMREAEVTLPGPLHLSSQWNSTEVDPLASRLLLLLADKALGPLSNFLDPAISLKHRPKKCYILIW